MQENKEIKLLKSSYKSPLKNKKQKSRKLLNQAEQVRKGP